MTTPLQTRYGQTGLRYVLGVFASRKEQSADDGVLAFLHTNRVLTRGFALIGLFIFGFLGWAAFAPLQSAILAPGEIVVESHRKTIQHLEGGIVKTIDVTDGQSVKAGQLLVALDDTQARTNLELLQDEADGLRAEEARLLAERQGADAVVFPADLLARQDNSKVAQIIAGERRAFEAKRDALQAQLEILTDRKAENVRVVSGYEAQQKALDTQLGLIAQEQTGVQKMVDEGLEPLPRLLALERQAADLTGQRGQLIEKIAQVQVSNGETDMQAVNLKNQALDDALKDLRDVQSKRYELMDKIQATRDILNRTMITAPVAGEVLNLVIHTRGAVIKPGDTIMEIVPRNDKLEVEAHIPPDQADQIYVGMRARLNLSSFEARRLPMITGEVTYISPDRQTDERTGQAYFVADVSVDRRVLRDLPEAHLVPGEPVEVAIQTGTRTALGYFIEPISDVIRTGMKER